MHAPSHTTVEPPSDSGGRGRRWSRRSSWSTAGSFSPRSWLRDAHLTSFLRARHGPPFPALALRQLPLSSRQSCSPSLQHVRPLDVRQRHGGLLRRAPVLCATTSSPAWAPGSPLPCSTWSQARAAWSSAPSGAVFGILLAFGVVYAERVITLLLFFVLPRFHEGQALCHYLSA